jgi:hypothetical protein
VAEVYRERYPDIDKHVILLRCSGWSDFAKKGTLLMLERPRNLYQAKRFDEESHRIKHHDKHSREREEIETRCPK